MAGITLHSESLRTLEVLVENFGMEGLVAGLAHICREKANRAFGDELESKLWARDAATLEQAAANLHK